MRTSSCAWRAESEAQHIGHAPVAPPDRPPPTHHAAPLCLTDGAAFSGAYLLRLSGDCCSDLCAARTLCGTRRARGEHHGAGRARTVNAKWSEGVREREQPGGRTPDDKRLARFGARGHEEGKQVLVRRLLIAAQHTRALALSARQDSRQPAGRSPALACTYLRASVAATTCASGRSSRRRDDSGMGGRAAREFMGPSLCSLVEKCVCERVLTRGATSRRAARTCLQPSTSS